jgi:serine/threonine protein kinase
MIGSSVLNYKIISVIGEGGMGIVYLAEHQTLRRKAAIKMLNPYLATNIEIKARFHNEALILAKLNHNNIVVLYDLAEFDNSLFLIMEYVEGTALDIMLKHSPHPIDEKRCLNIFKKILSGFSYAHQKGIIHRDIKLSNIILQPDDVPKILDFGIAKIIHGNTHLTQTGTRIGSVLYMSPEQILGREIDYRSDIYSLGVTLFEMLSGKEPYDTTTNSEYELQTKIISDPIPPIRSFNPGVSPQVEQVISRATAKNPSERFNNCDEFINALNFHNYGVTQPVYINQLPQKGSDLQKPQLISKSNVKIIIGLLISVIIIIAAILIYFIVSSPKDELEKITGTKIQKSPTTSGQTEEITLTGFYEGTIKDGTRWTLYISTYDGKNISGNNTTYWATSKSGSVSATFTGTYDKTTNQIIMDETTGGPGAGRFVGTVYESGKKMEGTWTRYRNNETFTWNLIKK